MNLCDNFSWPCTPNFWAIIIPNKNAPNTFKNRFYRTIQVLLQDFFPKDRSLSVPIIGGKESRDISLNTYKYWYTPVRYVGLTFGSLFLYIRYFSARFLAYTQQIILTDRRSSRARRVFKSVSNLGKQSMNNLSSVIW